ncbi:hypothetical protein DPEC_G00141650 [Dallia pectoralis]|uniref:Uncharacterized protein n=1 Tax=Dallia pectoralis TaxID=75939 RepID=A0ACC2GNA9_DALPE|nr:hypothetical protein DPEC_G00141650 [Dallia pectoralis]
MNFYVIILTLSGKLCTLAKVQHELAAAVGCFDLGETEITLMIDGDEVAYADFKNKKMEMTIPVSLPGILISALAQYNYAVSGIEKCKERLKWGNESVPSIPQVKDAPTSTIYTRNEVELGIKNTLICFVNNFFPPSIDVSWTKNGMDVTEETTLSRYYPNTDGTFHQFSKMSLTPKSGDVYACTVEHPALEEQETRIWEVSMSSGGPALFCRIGLTLGLLGLATGTFLLIKGKMKS